MFIWGLSKSQKHTAWPFFFANNYPRTNACLFDAARIDHNTRQAVVAASETQQTVSGQYQKTRGVTLVISLDK